MATGEHFTDLVQDALDAFLGTQEAKLAAISEDLAPVSTAARSLLSGGKRFRARFCYWGWRAAQLPDPIDPMPVEEDLAARDGIVKVAAALEILHAAALVHDDIIDRSAVRRGAPAAHEYFARLHRDSGWTRDADRFGTAAATLLGDLLLSWSDELFAEATLGFGEFATAARREFATMRAEVTLGQYLDVLEEHAWIAYPDAQAAARAQKVVVYKSAKYSVEAPLVIGALLGGADAAQVGALRGYGVPIGVAFQLRDDLLGVFGDPDKTGKPAGDDLREGKRTVLIAVARAALPGSARSLLDDLLGDSSLDANQIDMLRRTLRECGAVDRVERAIEHSLGQAIEVLRAAPIAPAAKAELRSLADAVAQRTA